MMMSDVSVIIPCYNQFMYVSEAVYSARDQTVPPKEIIVVDDGTEWPGYLPIEAKRIRQSNRGLPGARNTGIMNSKGEFILPLDADDVLMPKFIEITLGYVEGRNDPDIGVVYTAMETFSGERREPISPFNMDMLKHHNCLFYCALIRKTALLECGGYNTRMVKGYEDWNLWIDLYKRGWKFAYIPYSLFRYRERPGTMTEESDRHRGEIIEQIRKNHPELY
jgi:glycosyltransferase involved in cell wall biosynthesis